jgi:hypothetical protein
MSLARMQSFNEGPPHIRNANLSGRANQKQRERDANVDLNSAQKSLDD